MFSTNPWNLWTFPNSLTWNPLPGWTHVYMWNLDYKFANTMIQVTLKQWWQREITSRMHTCHVQSLNKQNNPAKFACDQLYDKKIMLRNTCGHLGLTTCIAPTPTPIMITMMFTRILTIILLVTHLLYTISWFSINMFALHNTFSQIIVPCGLF